MLSLLDFLCLLFNNCNTFFFLSDTNWRHDLCDLALITSGNGSKSRQFQIHILYTHCVYVHLYTHFVISTDSNLHYLSNRAHVTLTLQSL